MVQRNWHVGEVLQIMLAMSPIQRKIANIEKMVFDLLGAVQKAIRTTCKHNLSNMFMAYPAEEAATFQSPFV